MGNVKVSVAFLLAAVFCQLLLLPSPTKDLTDDVNGLRVVITGASSGIGEELTYQLAAMGATIVITARTEYKLRQVANKCKDLYGADVFPIAADLASFENASLVVSEGLNKLGGMDLLILNHFGDVEFGGYQHDPLNFQNALVVNMMSHAHIASRSVQALSQSKGRIVAVSSAVGFLGSPFMITYATAKSALNGFFTSLRHELTFNQSDVSVTLCHLGYIDTKSAERIKDNLILKPSSKKNCASEIVKSSMNRMSEMYFPAYFSWVHVFKTLFPSVMERAVQLLYKNV
uniref:Hydroxysteroid 11-beta-dehydrogenase 1-like protein n=1 Tax=Phallusia mammillata TaxID=59560 RepID=A0A6F9DE23_9ASCI|nr:hydroxysteroid 11-beta-dehydrogenase 1-like protein [Phallusia mammillata]